jgi:hypothetical protein
MPDATLVSKGFIGGGRVKQYRFSYATVLAGQTSAEIKLNLDVKYGSMVGIGVVCPTSVDFDFSLRQKTGVTPPDNDEIIKVENITPGSYKEFFSIPFKNMDAAVIDALYLKVTNTDAVNATGVIAIELLIEEG